jgi:hypothetical protein
MWRGQLVDFAEAILYAVAMDPSTSDSLSSLKTDVRL